MPALLIILSLLIPAHAISFTERCHIALTTLVTKGPHRVPAAWALFKNDNSQMPRRLSVADRRGRLEVSLVQLSSALGRPVSAENVDSTLMAVAGDHAQPTEVVEVALRTSQFAPLGEPMRHLETFGRHPHLADPADLLNVALNPLYPAGPAETAELVTHVLESERRADVYRNDVPYSARAGFFVGELHWQGRIDAETLVDAFTYMIRNPLANSSGLYWSLGALQLWAEGLYVFGRAVPSRSLTRPLIEAARTRIEAMKLGGARATQLPAIVDRTERLLDLE